MRGRLTILLMLLKRRPSDWWSLARRRNMVAKSVNGSSALESEMSVSGKLLRRNFLHADLPGLEPPPAASDIEVFDFSAIKNTCLCFEKTCGLYGDRS